MRLLGAVRSAFTLMGTAGACVLAVALARLGTVPRDDVGLFGAVLAAFVAAVIAVHVEGPRRPFGIWLFRVGMLGAIIGFAASFAGVAGGGAFGPAGILASSMGYPVARLAARALGLYGRVKKDFTQSVTRGLIEVTFDKAMTGEDRTAVEQALAGPGRAGIRAAFRRQGAP